VHDKYCSINVLYKHVATVALFLNQFCYYRFKSFMNLSSSDYIASLMINSEQNWILNQSKASNLSSSHELTIMALYIFDMGNIISIIIIVFWFFYSLVLFYTGYIIIIIAKTDDESV